MEAENASQARCARGVNPQRRDHSHVANTANRMAVKPAAKVPPELAAALAKNKKAEAAFDAFPPSHKREYVEWIAEAKREETRAKRVAQAVEWISEGRSRNWKYQ